MVTGIREASSKAGFDGMALSMTLSDRGNGVTRISGVSLVCVPVGPLDGWVPLVFPISLRVRDAVGVGLRLLGRCPCPGVPGGWCQCVTDADVEYLVYRVG